MFSLLIKDGDIVIEDNDLQLVEGTDEISQSVEIVLGTNKKEWFWNPDLGIEYSKILEKSNESQARNEIIQGIAQEPRIMTIEEVTISADNARKRLIDFKATATDGESIESEVSIGVG